MHIERRAFLRNSALLLGACAACDADRPGGPGALDTSSSGQGESSDGAGTSSSGESTGAGASCIAVATAFAPIDDRGMRTSFTRMDESVPSDWITIAGAAAPLMKVQVPAAVLALLRQLAHLHVGYPVDLLTHSLQTATRAVRANASDDLVLAALCHDVGCALTVEGHAEVSAAILRGYVGEEAYRVVRHHTELEWLHYGALIGQPTDQRSAHAGQPWYADAERFVDEWELVSFEPGYDALTLADFEALIVGRFGDGSLVHEHTAMDCIG